MRGVGYFGINRCASIDVARQRKKEFSDKHAEMLIIPKEKNADVVL